MRFVRLDGHSFIFYSKKCSHQFYAKRNPRKCCWTLLYRQAHRKGIREEVSQKKRSKLVEEFNGEKYVPFMVLSVKAGGTGLNLTAANHVIHFDRWWNPAVEDQATDRAFRIGQKKNVLVHKLVSKGTVEEKIDALINSKRELADNIIGAGGEKWITEMSNSELLKLLRLE